jgi:hypothetical protein
MKHLSIVAGLMLAMACIAGPAQACFSSPPINFDDVRNADVVVIGRIANYRIVRDQAARRDRRRMLANSPDMPADERRRMASQTEFLTDHARFDIRVEQTLVGRAGRVITVNWDNATFGEPRSMPSGPYLIALRHPISGMAPARGPGTAPEPIRDSRTLTILQMGCSAPFIIESGSEQADAIRAVLTRIAAQPNVR